MSSIYRCPLCQEVLIASNNTIECKNNHHFDFAKEGYINLLPVHHKNSKQPGDNLDMVKARRAFFTTSHYEFLRDALVPIIASFNPNIIIDLGCGEGFYTQSFTNEGLNTPKVYGVDISKSAIKYAAKRYKHINFSVASINNTPFKNGSADMLVSIFAPIFEKECVRLLNKDGVALFVSPGPKHLYELKNYIYDEVKLHNAITTPDGFMIVEQELIEQTHNLDYDVLCNLVKMTPFAWKFKQSHFEQLKARRTHRITFSFYITQCRKIQEF